MEYKVDIYYSQHFRLIALRVLNSKKDEMNPCYTEANESKAFMKIGNHLETTSRSATSKDFPPKLRSYTYFQ